MIVPPTTNNFTTTEAVLSNSISCTLLNDREPNTTEHQQHYCYSTDPTLTQTHDGHVIPAGVASLNYTDDLLFLYQNVRGLKAKCHEVFDYVSTTHYDVIILSETWLDSSFNSSQLFPDHYIVFRKDRNDRSSRKTKGGGVLIAVASHLRVLLCSTSDTVKQPWLKIYSIK